jgi:hypothetical protein
LPKSSIFPGGSKWSIFMIELLGEERVSCHNQKPKSLSHVKKC